MEVKCLPKDVQSVLRSGMQINSFKQCVSELVLNSLDAKATAIAVRINMLQFSVQVVDNGAGITKENLSEIGVRYMTNKCQSVRDLKRKQSLYGFRGEALASLRTISEKITISTRVPDVEETYSVVFEKGQEGVINPIRSRPSKGTTVTIENFLFNLPVRQNRVSVDVDMEDIRTNLEALAVIHPTISFSLRNNINHKFLFNTHATETVSQALVALHKEISLEDLFEFKISKEKIILSGLLCRTTSESKHLQFVYVNKRPIYSKGIRKHMISLLAKSYLFDRNALRNRHQFPIYIINISCSYTRVDFVLNSTHTSAEFKNWDIILKCLEKAVTNILSDGGNDTNKSLGLPTTSKHINDRKRPRSHYSLASGAFKSGFIKKPKKNVAETPYRNPGLMNNSDIIECTQQSKSIESKTVEHRNKRRRCSSRDKHKKLDRCSETKIETNIRNYFCEGAKCKSIFKEVESLKVYKSEKQKKKDYFSDANGKNKKYFLKGDDHLAKLFMQNYKIASLGNENLPKGDKNRTTSECSNECEDNIQEIAQLEKDVLASKNINTTDVVFRKPISEFRKVKQKSCFEKHNNTQSLLSTIDEHNQDNSFQIKPNANQTKTITHAPKYTNIVNEIHSGGCNEPNLLSNEESSGKPLIMDMFLKSTQIYCSKPKEANETLDSTINSLGSEKTPLKENYNSAVMFSLNFQKKTKNSIYTLNQTLISVKKKRDAHNFENPGAQKRTTEFVQRSPVRNVDKFASKSEQADFSKTSNELEIINNESNNDSNPILDLNDVSKLVLASMKNPCDQLEYCDFTFANERFEDKMPNDFAKPINLEKLNIAQKPDVLISAESSNNKTKEKTVASNNLGRTHQTNSVPKTNKTKSGIDSESTLDNMANFKISRYFEKLPRNEIANLSKCAEDKTFFINNLYCNTLYLQTGCGENRVDLAKAATDAKSVADLVNLQSNSDGNNCKQNKLFKTDPNNKNTENNNCQCTENGFNINNNEFLTYKSHKYNVNENIKQDFRERENIKRFRQSEVEAEKRKLLYHYEQYKAAQEALFNKNNNNRNDKRRLINKNSEENEYRAFENEIQQRTMRNIPILNIHHQNIATVNVAAVNIPTNSPVVNKPVMKNISSTPYESGDLTFPTGNINETLSDRIIPNSHDNSCIPWTNTIAESEVRNELNVEENKTKQMNPETIASANNCSKKSKSNVSEDLFGKDSFNFDFTFVTPQDLGNKDFRLEFANVENTNACKLNPNEANWLESADAFGKRFFINQRTGMCSFITPHDKVNFPFKKRIDFVPKGLSPVLEEVKPVDVSLSPTSKVNLHKKLFEHLNEELETIKWENYFTSEDPKSFFDTVYKLKNKRFEKLILDAAKDKLPSHIENAGMHYKNFDRDLFTDLDVIGPLDKKFIVAVNGPRKLLVLFDQHAVHERIRVEQLYKDYSTICDNGNTKLKSTALKEPVQINLNGNNSDIFETYKNNLETIGLKFNSNKGAIRVVAIPTCYFNKWMRGGGNDDLQTWITALINEEIEMIKSVRGINDQVPNIIKNIINMEACRGAIKFGDTISHDDCKMYIKLLSKCKFPFQCAHGRPSVAPIIKFNNSHIKQVPHGVLNFKKLLLGSI